MKKAINILGPLVLIALVVGAIVLIHSDKWEDMNNISQEQQSEIQFTFTGLDTCFIECSPPENWWVLTASQQSDRAEVSMRNEDNGNNITFVIAPRENSIRVKYSEPYRPHAAWTTVFTLSGDPQPSKKNTRTGR